MLSIKWFYLLIVLNTFFYWHGGMAINLIAALSGCLVIFLMGGRDDTKD